jgi:multiple sugar transport system substrate-binding protein
MSTRKAELNRRGFLGGSLLFVAGAVAACSSDPTGKSGGSSSGGGGTTTLNVWYHAYGETGTQDAVIRYGKAFTAANSDIQVKVTWIPGDYTAKLYSTLLTPDAPDVFEYGDFSVALARHGQIADLSDLYGDAKADFAQGDLDYVTVDGKQYGVKMIDDLMMLYYRKSVLAKSGIQPPKTFSDLADAAKELSTGGNKGLFISNDGVGDIPALAVWADGGDLVKDDKAVFGGDQAAQAVGALKRLHDDKSLLLGFTTDWWDPSAFTQGVVPMQWTGLWAMPQIQKELGDDFGILPWPGATAGTGAVRVGGWTSMVNAKGKNVEAAKKFVRWLWVQQTAQQKDFAESYGFHIPPRKSVAGAADKLASGSPKDAVALAQQFGHSFPNTWNTDVSGIFATAAGKVMTGSDPAKTLSDAAASAQPEIDKQLI